MAPKIRSLVGQRFGRLVAISATVKPEGIRPSFTKTSGWWLCKCDCGQSHITYISDLTTGGVQSCGCLARELSSARNSTHGMKRSSTYVTWQAMHTRCSNVNASNYRHYGGAGVVVCEQWKTFERFLSDMGERPAGTTIDRIDNDGNYERSNCRWATSTQQARNRPSTIDDNRVNEVLKSHECGESGASIARRIGISDATVSRIIARNRKLDDAD